MTDFDISKALALMNEAKEWLADPVRVFNTLSIFLAGVIAGLLLGL